jgi:hypothetical protein
MLGFHKALTVVAALTGFGLSGSPAALAQNVTTYHKAANRNGLYVAPTLTATIAKQVHLDTGFSSATLDGAVYGQPLYWAPPGGPASVIVATENDSVYALDANTGAQQWKTSLGTPVSASSLPCGNIDPLGVTGTPVIDAAKGTLYVAAEVETANGPRHQVFGLSLATGKVAPGWPVDIATGLKTLKKSLDNLTQGERSALALVDGRIYVPFAGRYGDCTPYNGMVVSLSVSAPAVDDVWMTKEMAGGSWGLSGVAYDGTSMFVTTGNGVPSGSSALQKWGGSEAVVRLAPPLEFSTNPIDYFAPSDWKTLDAQDLDLGGTSAIPIDVPVEGGAPDKRVLALGKDGNAYLLHRGNLGGVGGQIVSRRVSHSEIVTAMATYPAATAAMVAFENGSPVCPAGESGNLSVLEIGAKAITPAWCASFNGDGAPIVTTTDGKAQPIVWVVGSRGDGKLYGFNGNTGALIVAAPGGPLGFAPRQTPIWANGRFYVAANGAVYAFAY